MTFDIGKAFYVFNLAANWAYSRYADIYPVMLEKIVAVEEDFMIKAKAMDAKALEAYKESPRKAVEMVR